MLAGKFIHATFTHEIFIDVIHLHISIIKLKCPGLGGSKKEATIFLSGTIGYANKGALLGGSAKVIFPSQFGIYIRAFTNQYNSKLLPVDYKPRSSFFGKPPIPWDITNVYSIGAIKEVTLKKSLTSTKQDWN